MLWGTRKMVLHQGGNSMNRELDPRSINEKWIEFAGKSFSSVYNDLQKISTLAKRPLDELIEDSDQID